MEMVYAIEGAKVITSVEEQDAIVLSQYTTITQDAVEFEGEIVLDNSQLKVVDGVVEYDAEAVAEQVKRRLIQGYKQDRDKALNNNTVEMLEHEFDARPQDLSNIQLGIEKDETLWPDVNDYMVDVTVSDLQTLLSTGITQGEKIWDDYKQGVKAIQ